MEHGRGTRELAKSQATRAEKHFQRSTTLLTEALARQRWQATQEPERYQRAIYYNRACGFARLGELAADEQERRKLFRQAVDDLKQTFPDQTPQEQRKNDFEKDLQKDGDLFQLPETKDFRDEVTALRKETQ